MKIHVLSDLHLELTDFCPSSTDADVVVLAGDIGVGMQGIDWAKRVFATPVIYVLGNHEYYGSGDMDDFIRHAKHACQGTQVQLLDNNAVTIGGVRFLGTTLWTDFALCGDSEVQLSMDYAQIHVSDYRQIQTAFDGLKQVSPRLLLARHHIGRDFLERSLEPLSRAPNSERTVVVTHHAPSASSLKMGCSTDRLDAAYASHLDSLVARTDLWIHGHTHVVAGYQVPEIGRFSGMGRRVVCNPRGYSDRGVDLVKGFNPGLVVGV